MKLTQDTTPAAEAAQLCLLRAAPPARRIELALMLSDVTRHLARRAIDRAHPRLSERAKDLFFVRVHYGAELARRIERYLENHDAT